jgi:hypothetical protein
MGNEQLLEEIADGHGENLVTAAKRFPSYRRGRPVTLSCLVRWILTGVKCPGGTLVRLEAARCAGRWLTTPQAICRFIAKQTPTIDGAPTPLERGRTPGRRQQAANRAARKLEEIGI